MHVYSAENEKRIKVIIVCVIISLFLAFFLGQYEDIICERIGINEREWFFLESGLEMVFSFSIFGMLYGSYRKWFWKLLVKWHGIPDFSGNWEMEIRSSIKNQVSKGEVEIKQDWSKIGIHTKSENGTEAKSHMGEITMDGIDIYLNYSFQVDRNGESYIGFNELKYDKEQKLLKGRYFTSKKFNKKWLESMGVRSLKDDAIERLMDGIGSKGTVYMKKIT